MAVITLTIPDELLEVYASKDPKKTPQKTIVAYLNQFKDVTLTDRVVILSGEDRQALESLTGNQVNSAKDIVSWGEKVGRLSLNNVNLNLSPGQVKRIETSAKFWKQNPEEFLSKQLQNALRNTIGV
jgi:hypothetical protein